MKNVCVCDPRNFGGFGACVRSLLMSFVCKCLLRMRGVYLLERDLVFFIFVEGPSHSSVTQIFFIAVSIG